MSDEFTLHAEARADVGKGASRRLRREGKKVPAIVYGGSKKPENISIPHKDLAKHLENEAFYSHIIELKIGDKGQNVILKDLQRHPAKNQILHADFMRVSKSKKLQTKVPLHFMNEDKAHGVKMQGGIVNHNMTELDIECLPGDLPEYIEVDLLEMEVGDTLHISDLKLPKGVESVSLNLGEDHDLPVISINKPKAAAPEDEEEGGEEEGGEEEGES